MALLVLLCAAIVCTGAAFVIPRSKNTRVRQLACAYWAVTVLLLVLGFVGQGGLDAFLHFDKLAEHAALGILLVALVLAVWTVFCLFNGFGRNGDEQ